MPIDAFLRSLAEDHGEKSIGIILSGTGTDGTLGLRAIFGAGGMTLVQEPSSAKYDGMPSSAIQAGYATHVLPVEKMPAMLQSGAHVTAVRSEGAAAFTPAAVSGMNHILVLLRSATGHDFSLYKKSTIGRRIERRMFQHNIEDVEVYARFLKQNRDEAHILFKELLINVTSFFRDPEAFALLKQDILPRLFAGKPADYVLRVWVAGCATGEEAYSIAIVLREFIDETQQEYKTQIYATDLDDDAIAVARAGLYPLNIAADLSPERVRRFFVKDDAGYRIKKEIREMVVFAIHNVIKDPAFTKLDLLSCRNLMIYMEPELQNRLIPVFHYALKPGGVLFLSPFESIGGHANLFTSISRHWKFYHSVHSLTSSRELMASGLPIPAMPSVKEVEEVVRKTKQTNFGELTKRALLLYYAPASVMTDPDGNILFVHGETGKYLRPAPGQATLNLVEMAREGLQLELRDALQTTSSHRTPTLNREVSIQINGDLQTVSMSVRPLPSAHAEQDLLLVSFQDVAQTENKPASGKRVKHTTNVAEARRNEILEHELAYTRENLKANIEKQQASNEELKSTNEELQSTNEEMQSTNEELETSKEELQSLNEELVTVNSELQSKIEQLIGMQNDMKNLLDNINIGTIFLDPLLRIRRFTQKATRTYRLIGTDVGRALADIKSDINSNDLLAEAQIVLDTLVPYEREVCVSNGIWYLARIQPYRTLGNVIDGVVLTFADISSRVAAEIEIQEARKLDAAIIDTLHEPLLVLDSELRVIRASRAFYTRFQVRPEKTVGCLLYDLGNHQWDIPKLRELLEDILPRDQSFDNYLVEHDFPTIGHRRMRLNACRIDRMQNESSLILLAIEDEVTK